MLVLYQIVSMALLRKEKDHNKPELQSVTVLFVYLTSASWYWSLLECYISQHILLESLSTSG